MTPKLSLICLAVVVATALVPASAGAASRSSIKVGIADQSPTMFASPEYRALKLKQTRYFVPENVMSDSAALAKATAFVRQAKQDGVSTFLHISTSDLRSKRGKVISTSRYRSHVKKTVAYFRKLGVKQFGSWNEVNHKTQETYNHIGNAVSYFKSMYSAVKSKCRSCTVVGLDVLDQAGVDRYMKSFYKRLSSTWRKRLGVIGIHNYSDVNRGRTTGTAKIIKTAHRYNRKAKFWFTETGALASFGGSFRYSESRQASRMKNMFKFAKRYKGAGVQRVYAYNWTGAESSTACGSKCLFDAGLLGTNGSARPAYGVFRTQLRSFSR